jgi:ubiquinone/menaquinone biosynthesis C-methylase UbiE
MIKIKFILLFTLFLAPLFFINFLQFDSNRDLWQQPEKIMDTIGVKPGMVIGEPGAGEGYFTFKLSQRVGKAGKIYANDIEKKKLEKIRETGEEKGIKNITTILGEQNDPLFPCDQLDMVVMVYVFHHLKNPVAYLKNIKPSLKDGANVIIIERDPKKYEDNYNHFMNNEDILEKIKKAEYTGIKIATFLPRDNIYICHP